MENKSLKVIQGFAKAGKIISGIVFGFSIMGAAICLAGLLGYAALGSKSVTVGGVTVYGLINQYSGVSEGTAVTAMAVGMLFCGAEIAIAKLAQLYFKHELRAGTPFTLEGAKELLRLGICTAVISAAASGIGAMVFKVLSVAMDKVADMKLDGFGSVGMGVAFILVSFICRYGAELAAAREDEIA